ncbi:hypothetical protein [Rhizobium rhizogenes]|uniref:hypothetical protein n=1 Tax=Rhizobium rhizogenes TaxID=359 RepID=UPI00129679D3|nr:hypothetical protein [Rhizobium rhizogenes]MQB35123.1 hypothetical protein [Rhizobium rhizogenes]
MFNIENLQSLVTQAYIPHAVEAFGEQGRRGITTLLNAVKLIYQRFPPEKVSGTLTVVVGIDVTPGAPIISAIGTPTVCRDYECVGKYLAQSAADQHVFLEVVADGTFRLFTTPSDVDLASMAQNSLIYRFEGESERILARQFNDVVPAISPVLLSNFSTPTLRSLEEALRYYGDYVIETRCRILKTVWEGGVDGPRLVLVNRPEATMRDSLVQALELVLRDVTVRPEQNTDESKPVDIRINWFASGATALIEVKWLGKATAKPQPGTTSPSYTEYGAPRAQSGANQLADYMDREVRHSSATAPRGYLVVFDARRRGTKGAADALPEKDAMAFAHDVIAYSPDHSEIRDDFAQPVRFFMNPRKSHFAETKVGATNAKAI